MKNLSGGFAFFPLLVVFAVVAISYPFYWFYNQSTLSFDVDATALAIDQQVSKNSEIRSIKIESLEIDLPVKKSRIVGGNWEYFSDSASHLGLSVRPFDNGNIVIFAKSREGLFDELIFIKKGDMVEVTTADGFVNIYEVKEYHEVAPYDSEYVTPKDLEVLTLFTDSGPFSIKRFVVLAYPVN